jgi:hypothetical protein
LKKSLFCITAKKKLNAGLPGAKNKKAKFGNKQFQKSEILKNKKGTNKGQIFFRNLFKQLDSKLEFHYILQVLLRFLPSRL